MLVLNSAKAAIELMDQRSAIYSSRPRFAMLNELYVSFRIIIASKIPEYSVSLKLDWNMAFMPYGARWREYSRVFHQFFNPRTTQTYRFRIQEEVKNTLKRFHASPEDFMAHFRQ